ncbi:arsenate reductase family protein [Imtechella halotolerans]|uniref:Arsenate reductase n=1 Tax=Imtechella halotolerans K1 TaxID=946077 RepID=I0WJU1_9FLAO|nr:ArsC/Spx/MgsR family protein [Imtechella halotolerans]EID76657.1 hypothetical protein W5A_01500 [Imtechella halotolerans K1]WMQ62774.1 ArsC/Spx/MgsR family protein [Imtechella halotolerans]
MKHFYFLSSCDTCKRILKELELPNDFILQDIKNQPLSEKELESLHLLSGSYEKLFSKRARLYKERNLKDKKLSESDMKSLILEHYTFLNRPIIVINQTIFIGNSTKTIMAAKEVLHEQ